MSDALAVAVHCYAGDWGRRDTAPLHSRVQRVEILAVVDQWRTLDHRYFRVRTAEETCTLRQDVRSGGWDPMGLERSAPR